MFDIRHRPAARHAAFWTVPAAIVAICFELCCFGLARLRPDLFDHREAFLATLHQADFNRVKSTTASNLLGWDNPISTSVKAKNCAGEEVTYTYGS